MDNLEENAAQQVHVTLNRPIRVLHFSDGVEEEIEDVEVKELQATHTAEDHVDTKSLTWGPWFSYYAWKSGTKVLSAVDYAGESLAGFFGITSPKYQIEINEYERIMEEKKKLEEESVGWVPKSSGGNIPLVLNEPVISSSNPVNV